MDPATKPNPDRFLVYNLLPDGKGFTLKGCKYVFKLDRYGGWRDQYGNYYNANGEPDFQPEDAELTPSEGSLHSDQYAEDYDEFEPNYEEHEEEEEEQYSSWEIRNMERLSKNMQTLSAYPKDKPLRVYFSNMPFKAPPKSVYEAYSKKAPGIVNIIFDLEDNRRNGEGHFIMEDSKKAEVLVKLQGERVLEREVHFQVEKLAELIMDPIKEKDMVPFWNPKAIFNNAVKSEEKKDDIPRFKAAPAEEKKQQKKPEVKTTTQQKQTPKTQQKQQSKTETKVQKKQQPPKQQPKPNTTTTTTTPTTSTTEFKRYRLNFQIFESKTRFYNFIIENKGNKDTDIGKIDKEEKDGVTKITIELKADLVAKINGKSYNGKEVKLTPV